MIKKKLRIGFVLDDSLDTTDGVQQYVLTLGKWLSAQGHIVKYLVGQSSRTDINGVHSLGKNIAVRFNQNKLTIPLPTSNNKIEKLLAQEKFNVLHVQMPYSPFLAGRIISAADSTTAIVGTFHILPASNLVSLATGVLGKIVQKQLTRFDAICCVSEPAHNYMQKVFRTTGTVIPNGIDVANFSTNIKPKRSEKPKIVFLGRLVERKGAEYLLRAFARMKNNDKLQLVIGGRGPRLASLERLANNLGIEKSVNFLGFVPESDKAELLRSATIAVFPSVGGESFGIVLIEAIASGAGVVIGGNNSGYSSVLTGPKEQLIDPKDTEQFSNRLESIIEDASLAKTLHDWQQTLLKDFDIETVGPKVIKLYAAALHKRRESGIMTL